MARSSRFAFVLSAFLFLTLFSHLTAQPPAGQVRMAAASPDSGELLVANFIDGIYGATTANSYSGTTTLTVSGIGQASGTVYTDAFYQLTDPYGNPIPPIYAEGWIFSINGQRARDFIPGGQIPAYQADHTYTFDIDAPGGQLIFGVHDFYTPDNTGSYIIQVNTEVAQSVPFFSQRDARWRDHPLRTNGVCSTYCSTSGTCGCTLTSAAMLFRYYGANLNPASLSDCMGTSACPFSWTAGASCSGGNATLVARTGFDWSRLDQELNVNQRPVLVGMHLASNSARTHWVLAISGSGNSPDNYLVHDPWPLDGANTSMAVLVRQGYVFDALAIYDGDPGLAPIGPVMTGEELSGSSVISADIPGAPTATPATPSRDASSEEIVGSITVFHVNLTAVVVELAAQSDAGIVEMQLWTDSHPAAEWQPYTTMAWLPWELGDNVYARFRDGNGTISADFTDSLIPTFNPPASPSENYLPLLQVAP
jgi:hypothetical protein